MRVAHHEDEKPREFQRFEDLASRLLKAPKVETVTEHMKVSPFSVDELPAEKKPKKRRQKGNKDGRK